MLRAKGIIHNQGTKLRFLIGYCPQCLFGIFFDNDCSLSPIQGGRKGEKESFAIYLGPWHARHQGFLGSWKEIIGKEEMRARDFILMHLWILIYSWRVEQNLEWSLFCPNEAQDYLIVHEKSFGKNFNEIRREEGRETNKAQELWFEF